ncbi:hypothetical protein [Streptomyces sp. AD55]|uniref:hypothetical protein n=1 Tax=Streptomyces sp. AD55 TaxID=3242895 RepID=UPI003529136F
MQYAVPAVTSQAAPAFKIDDYVLYRDPAKFWAGQPGHTFVCRVIDARHSTTAPSRYNLRPLGGGHLRDIQGDYLRLLPPVDAMRDIDTAPLRSGTGIQDMTAAGMAWLTEQAATTNRKPELPELPTRDERRP